MPLDQSLELHCQETTPGTRIQILPSCSRNLYCWRSGRWQLSLADKCECLAWHHEFEGDAALALREALDVGEHEALPLGGVRASHHRGVVLDGGHGVDDEAQLAALIEVFRVGLRQGLVQLAFLLAGQLLERRAGELRDRQAGADVL